MICSEKSKKIIHLHAHLLPQRTNKTQWSMVDVRYSFHIFRDECCYEHSIQQVNKNYNRARWHAETYWMKYINREYIKRKRKSWINESYTYDFCAVCVFVCAHHEHRSPWGFFFSTTKKGIIYKMNHNTDQSTKLMFIVALLSVCCPSPFFLITLFIPPFPAINKNIGFACFIYMKPLTNEISKKFQFHALLLLKCFALIFILQHTYLYSFFRYTFFWCIRCFCVCSKFHEKRVTLTITQNRWCDAIHWISIVFWNWLTLTLTLNEIFWKHRNFQRNLVIF